MMSDDGFFRDIASEVGIFIKKYPEAVGQVIPLLQQMAGPRCGDLDDRKNMAGHVTGSAFVLNHDLSQMLVIHHLAYDRLIPPGGHVDRGEGPWETSRRETKEETGVGCLIRIFDYPVDIDTHPIAARRDKKEGNHRHHDFMYLYGPGLSDELKHQDEEVAYAAWKPIATAAEWADERTLRVIQRLAPYFNWDVQNG